MIVYATEKFIEDVKKHGLQKQVTVEKYERLVRSPKEVEAYFHSRGKKGQLLSRRVSDNLRIIATVRSVLNRDVLIFLTVLPRKDPDYPDILDSPPHVFDKLIDESQLQDLVLRRIADDQATSAAELKPLDDGMRAWLQPPRWGLNENSAMVYESLDWIRQFERQDVRDFWSKFYELVFNTLDMGPESPGQLLSSETGDRKCGILYSWVELNPEDAPGLRRQALLLVSPYFAADCSKAKARAAEIVERLASQGTLRRDDVAAEAGRAYPDCLAWYDEIWHRIEIPGSSDPAGSAVCEANLALSDEEVGVLERIADPRNPCLPIFINGRAGSGKSTLLSYIFADYVHRKLANPSIPGHPVFLTYSPLLCAAARRNVEVLLRCNERYLENVSFSEEQLSELLDRCFRSFSEILISCLPVEMRANFRRDRRVTFSVFKRLYSQRPDNNDPAACHMPESRWIPAELAWYGIRTFIKGFDEESFLTPEEYAGEGLEVTVHKDDRVLNREIYSKIWGIWRQWYSHIGDHGYWDDLDLVRAVLNCGIPESSRFPVIVCDEAQDFTRIEYQLILRLSTLPDYDLSREFDSRAIPFAFAGDPFQTLNPTGFRWESVRAAFQERIIDRLSLPTAVRPDLEELSRNYRSSHEIVKLSNTLQFWRAHLMNDKTVRPQQGWRKPDEETAPPPMLFVIEESASVENVRDLLLAGNRIVLLPCDEGEESEFIEKDEILSVVFGGADGVQREQALSAVAAKGLEFRTAILYRFGEFRPEALSDFGSADLGEEQQLEAEYYLNKLYVAVTRAQRSLVVIETREGKARWWDLIERVCKLIEERGDEKWRRCVGSVAVAAPEDLMAFERETNDPTDLAAQFENLAAKDSNPDYYRRAAYCWRRADKNDRAIVCDAEALLLEEKFVEAGDKFRSVPQARKRAAEAYWRGMNWNKLIELSAQFPADVPDAHRAVARFMLGDACGCRDLVDIAGVLQAEASKEDPLLSEQWQKCADKLADAVRDVANFNSYELRAIADSLNAAGRKVPRFCARAADIYEQIEDYRSTAECLEWSGEISTPRYYRIKSRSTEFPECLKWLNAAGQFGNTIEIWAAQGEPIEGADCAATALEKTGQLSRAIEAYARIGNRDKVRDLADDLKGCSGEDLVNGITAAISCLVDAGEYDCVARVLNETWQSLPELTAATLAARFCRALAESDLKLGSIADRDAFASYRDILWKLDESAYAEFLISPVEIGLAWERTGEQYHTLRFYDRLVEDACPWLCRHARLRWVSTRMRQIERMISEGDTRARNSINDLVYRCEHWFPRVLDRTVVQVETENYDQVWDRLYPNLVGKLVRADVPALSELPALYRSGSEQPHFVWDALADDAITGELLRFHTTARSHAERKCYLPVLIRNRRYAEILDDLAVRKRTEGLDVFLEIMIRDDRWWEAVDPDRIFALLASFDRSKSHARNFAATFVADENEQLRSAAQHWWLKSAARPSGRRDGKPINQFPVFGLPEDVVVRRDPKDSDRYRFEFDRFDFDCRPVARRLHIKDNQTFDGFPLRLEECGPGSQGDIPDLGIKWSVGEVNGKTYVWILGEDFDIAVALFANPEKSETRPGRGHERRVPRPRRGEAKG